MIKRTVIYSLLSTSIFLVGCGDNGVQFKSCQEAGRTITKEDAGWNEALDKDRDGVACESYGT